LTWTAPVDTGGSAITDYVVEFNDGSGFATFVDGTSTSTNATVTGLTNGTSYTFRVSATSVAGTGATSVVSSAATPRTTPGPPTGVSGTSGNTSVSLTWTAPTSNGGSAITDYVVQSSPDGSIWTTFADGTSTLTSATVTGLTNGQGYTFRVAAANVAGTGNFSTASGSVTPATVPGAPTSVSGTPGNTSVSLTWSAPASNGGAAITDYVVEFSSGAGFAVFADGTSATTSATVTGLTNGTPYTFRVSATNSVGTGATSVVSSSVSPRTVPDAPTSVSGIFGNTSVSLTWSAPASDGQSAITDYVVEFNDGSGFAVFADGTSTATSASVTGLTNGTSYTFRVSAVNAAGTGAASSASSAVIPRTFPSAPTSVSGTPGNTSVSLTWTAPSNGGAAITDYVVEFSSGAGFAVFADGTSAATSATVTGLTNGTPYTFRVSATNNVSTGAVSTASSAVTPRTVPDAPTSVSGIFGNTSVSLTWAAPASDGQSAITDYVVEFNDGSGFAVFADGTSTATSATVTGLTNGTSYTFRVSAVNAAGTGAASAASSAVIPRTFPSAPTSVSGTPGNTQVSLTWTAPSNGGAAITDYVVEFNDGVTWATFADGTSATAAATVTGLTNGTPYTFRVSATNNVSTGAVSTASSAVTPRTVPDAPASVSGTSLNASVSLTWTAPVITGGSAITDYVVEFSSGAGFTTFADGISTAASATVTGLTNGTAYTFRVSAVNAAGTGAASSASIAVIPLTVPSAPTGVSGTPGNAQVSLTWTAPSNGGIAITDYVVEFNNGSGFAVFADGTSTATSATVTGLTNGTGYTFRVSATNSVGTGATSSVSAAVTPATVPGAPTGLTGASGAARVALNWTAPADNGSSAITDYIVEFNDGVSWAIFAHDPSTTTSMSVTGLTNGTGYTFRVSAVNSVGTGASSAVSISVTPLDAPAAPTGVSGTPGNLQVSLTWTAPTSNGGTAITNYVIESSVNGTTWNPFSHAPSTSTSATITGLSNGTAYTFRVSATNSVGTGATSAVSAAVTPRTVPGAPTSVSGTSGNTQVSLTWTAPASNGGSAITDYVVEFNDGSGFATFADGTSATAAATVTGLTNGTAYTFRVSATNAAGTGSTSTVSASVTPLTTPGAPTGVSGTPGNTQVVLTWAAPSSVGGSAITDYVVEFNNGVSWSTFADGTSASTGATVTGLSNGTAYTFRVSATNSVGTGASSAVSAAVTPRTLAGAPTGVSGTAGDTQVSLTWTAPASNGGNAITDYLVEFNDGVTWATFADGTSTTTSTTVTGLTNDTAYTFRVSAVNIAGTGLPGVSTAVTPRAKPGAPTGVAGTRGNTEVALTWTAPSSDGGSAITDYVVESSTNGTDWTVFADGTSTTTSTTVTGLTNGTAYTFRVSATSSIGTGATSVVSAAVTPATLPGGPTGVSGTAGDTRVFLTWTAPSSGGSAITDYVVEFNDGSGWATFADGTSGTASATVTGLTNGTAYTFRVTAVNGVGTGATSSASSAVTPVQPQAATATVSITAGDGELLGTVSSVVTNGSIISGIGFRVDSGSWVDTGLTGAGNFTIPSLENGTTYSVEIRIISSGIGSPVVLSAVSVAPVVTPTTTTTTTTTAPAPTPTTTTTTTTIPAAPPNAAPSTTTTTTTIAPPPTTIPATTSTTIPQPVPATSTTIPTSTTTTTIAPLFEAPTVITASDGATIMQMDVPLTAGSPDAAPIIIAVVVPPEANTQDLVWNMMMSDRVQQSTVDEGYMTIEVTANMRSGESVTTMDAPIQILLPAPPLDGVLAYSRDGVTWTLIPQLLVPTLPENQEDGYFVQPDGTIILITRHLTGFGIRKPQGALELSVAKVDIVSGSVSRAVASGGTSEDPIRYQTVSDPSICRVTDSGLIYGKSAGICTVFATRGGGSIYLDTSSSTFSTSVVTSIVPIVPGVANLPLILQLMALIALCVLLGILGNRAWLTISGYRSNSTKL
jgi:titin